METTFASEERASGPGDKAMGGSAPKARRAINRLILAEVPAAVLTLVSPEAAEVFPEVAGFRIFRVPLSLRPLKPQP